jgi:hypothetical protein
VRLELAIERRCDLGLLGSPIVGLVRILLQLVELRPRRADVLEALRA